MKLDEFFVTGDPIIYGADASIVLVTLAIPFRTDKVQKMEMALGRMVNNC